MQASVPRHCSGGTHPILLSSSERPGEYCAVEAEKKIAWCRLGWYPRKGQMISCVAIGLAWFSEQGDKSDEKPSPSQEVNRAQIVTQNLNQFLKGSSGKKSAAVWRGAGCREDFQEEVGRKRGNKDTAMLSTTQTSPYGGVNIEEPTEVICSWIQVPSTANFKIKRYKDCFRPLRIKDGTCFKIYIKKYYWLVV